MTREEAITVLNMVEAHGSLVIQAKDMAIQALTQESSGDLISRKAINKLRRYNLIGGMSTVSLDDINKLPPVKQKPICPSHGVDCEDCPAYEPCDDAISRNDMLDAVGHGTTYTSLEVQKIINGLPSVNPVPCDDAISRQAVMDALCDECELFKNGEQTCFSKCEEYHFLATLPSLRPQESTGHWECNELFYEGESRGAIIRCSKCGNEFKVSPKVFENLYGNERFCNHCGAKMVEEQEASMNPYQE